MNKLIALTLFLLCGIVLAENNPQLIQASAPLTLTNGYMGIPQANGTTNGFLSSSDWTKFTNGVNISVGTIDSQSPSSNGLYFNDTTSVLYGQSASSTYPGFVNNTTQSFSGNKSFTGSLTVSSLGTGIAHLSSAGLVSSSAVALNGSDVTNTLGVANGGTGNSTLFPYYLMAGGTSGTGAMQQVSGVGTTGQVLTSNGASALPTWQSNAAVEVVGTYDSQSAAANGLVISGNDIYAQSASTSNPGMVNNTTQSLSGAKTFTSGVTINNSSGPNLTAQGGGGGAGEAYFLNASGDTGHYNWRIGGQLALNQSFEVTPSTTQEGTTFTTPVFYVNQNGTGTITGNFNVGGSTLELNQAGVSATQSAVVSETSDGGITIAGGTTGTSGSSFRTYGPTHATKPLWLEAYQGSAEVLQIDGSSRFGFNGTSNSSDGYLFYSPGGSSLTGASQAAISNSAFFNSSATTSGYGYYVNPQTQAASFTAPIISSYYANNLTIGSGSTVTRFTQYGGVTPSGATNNSFISDNASYTGSWFINSSSSNPSTFAGQVQYASTTNSTSTTTGGAVFSGGIGVANAVWIGGLLNVASTTTLQGTTTINAVTTISPGVSNAQTLTLVGGSSIGTGNIVLKNPSSSGFYNWGIFAQNHESNALEITPSTTVDSTTFNSPVFYVTQAGNATVSGSLTAASLSSSGTAALGNITGNYIQLGSSAGNNVFIAATGTNLFQIKSQSGNSHGLDISDNVSNDNITLNAYYSDGAFIFQTNSLTALTISSGQNSSFSGNVSSTGTITSTTSGTSLVLQGGASAGGSAQFLHAASSGDYNFQLSNGVFNNNYFEVTPSTATDGTTFSTPILRLGAVSGNVFVPKTLEVGPSAGGNSTSSIIGYLRSDQNANTELFVGNNTSGASAVAQIVLQTNTDTFSISASPTANSGATRITSGSGYTNGLQLVQNGANPILFQTNSSTALTITGAGSTVVGSAALATSATDGFLYIPTCAGTPTGTPTSHTGTIPIVFDTTDGKLYFYTGGAWVGLAD